MKTIQFLNEHGLEGLTPLAINTNFDANLNVYSLMYDQINSPTGDPIVQECRGLIVRKSNNLWGLVSRGFDRFFNYGERETTIYKDTQLKFYPKLDGSLIKVYYHEGKYHIASKSRAVAGTLTGFREKTKRFQMRDLVYKALGITTDEEFQTLMAQVDFRGGDVTFIFELTTPDNQVVTPYTDYRLTLLAVRENFQDVYHDLDYWEDIFTIAKPAFVGTPAEAIEAARARVALKKVSWAITKALPSSKSNLLSMWRPTTCVPTSAWTRTLCVS